jgi:DNA repair exonuclease SbcCD ATPase subunit
MDRTAPAEAWSRAAADVAAAHAAAGGSAAEAAHRQALQAAARLGEQVEVAERAAVAAVAKVRAALTAAGFPAADSADLTAETSQADLLGLRAAIASHLPNLPPEDVGDVREARDRLQDRIRILRHEVARLEGELGLQAADLDVAASGLESEAFTRALEVRGRAADMVEEAARSVAEAVLPSTMDYLRRLLPRLTGHRYFDARLTEDYHIEVWDDLAAGWRRKAIFSGGAKDQFSLALRLAFALATLPEERGTAPGFLFLDEPLSSFDAERAAALIAVLTDGEVARSFDQVFLVSHVPVGDGLFDYRITMADGEVVEGDLPAR